MKDLSGQTLGQYKIVRKLGSGGMATVYKAHEMSLNRMVALKVIGAHLAEDESFIERFKREAMAAAQLNHPGIVQVYAIGETDGIHYFAMEYVKGRSLAQIIKEEGFLTAAKALPIIRQAAEALGAAHEAGIVHRDIKPANIMIDPVGRVKVADFGIAHMAAAGTRLTRQGFLVGTPEYISPEQCQGLDVDARSDIYSLGVTLYQALSGRTPFEADTPAALVLQIAQGRVPPLRELNPTVPDQVQEIVRRMMDVDREERFQSCEDLLDALDAVKPASLVPTAQRAAAAVPPATTEPSPADGEETIAVGDGQRAAAASSPSGTAAASDDQQAVGASDAQETVVSGGDEETIAVGPPAGGDEKTIAVGPPAAGKKPAGKRPEATAGSEAATVATPPGTPAGTPPGTPVSGPTSMPAGAGQTVTDADADDAAATVPDAGGPTSRRAPAAAARRDPATAPETPAQPPGATTAAPAEPPSSSSRSGVYVLLAAVVIIALTGLGLAAWQAMGSGDGDDESTFAGSTVADTGAAATPAGAGGEAAGTSDGTGGGVIPATPRSPTGEAGDMDAGAAPTARGGAADGAAPVGTPAGPGGTAAAGSKVTSADATGASKPPAPAGGAPGDPTASTTGGTTGAPAGASSGAGGGATEPAPTTTGGPGAPAGASAASGAAEPTGRGGAAEQGGAGQAAMGAAPQQQAAPATTGPSPDALVVSTSGLEEYATQIGAWVESLARSRGFEVIDWASVPDRPLEQVATTHVVIDARVTATETLEYFGESSQQVTVVLTMRAVSPTDGRSLGSPVTGSVKYTALTAERTLGAAVRRMATQLFRDIR